MTTPARRDPMTFFVPGRPTPKQSTRFGGGRSFPDHRIKAAEDLFAARAVAHRPEQPWPGPIRAEYCFVFRVPKSWPKWKRERALAGRPHLSVPDRGNLVKLVEDALQGLFFVDDKQIYHATAIKSYGPEEGVQVTLHFEAPLPEKKP